MDTHDRAVRLGWRLVMLAAAFGAGRLAGILLDLVTKGGD